MTARAESSAVAPVSGGRLGAIAATCAAVALALTPITAVLTLGWLVRLARREAMIALLSQGWALRRTTSLERGVLVLAGLLLVFPSLFDALAQVVSGRALGYSATIGLGLALLVLLRQYMQPSAAPA